MPSDAEIILNAKATLEDALGQLGIRPTDDAFYWMLGLVWGESRFGQSPDWTIPNALNDEASNPGAPAGPSHNWGAVKAGASAPFIWHHDRDSSGVLGTFKFARFTTALGGAKHFVSVLARGRVPAVLNGQGSAHDLAAAMFDNHYYTGTTGTPEDRINAYANMILSGASKVRQIAGASPMPASRPTASPSPVVASGVQVSGKTLALAVGGASVLALGYHLLQDPSSLHRLSRKLGA